MKKFILRFIIIILLILTVVFILFAIKYHKLYTTSIDINNSGIQTQSNKTYPIDIELDKCISENFMTVGMNNCTNNGIDAWNREIKNYSKKIVKYINPNGADLFNTSQKAWQDYYNKEKEFLNNTIAQKEGDIHTTIVAGILYELTKERALYLKSYLINIKE